jgi:hypothetical protein
MTEMVELAASVVVVLSPFCIQLALVCNRKVSTVVEYARVQICHERKASLLSCERTRAVDG